MATAYSLKFLEQTFPFDNQVEIVRSRNNVEVVPQYFVFLDGKLYNFKQDQLDNWQRSLLLSETLNKKVLYFPKTLNNGESVILLKTNTGIDFYQYTNNRFELLLQTHDFDANLFHDVYDWDKPGNMIRCGHFYYDKNIIGILSKHQEHGLQFHAVMKNELTSGEYPVWPLKTDLSSLGNTASLNFFLADLQSKGQENIIVRSRNGMHVYEFNQGNKLQLLLQVPDSSKTSGFEENLFFPSLTGQPLKDIVVFNSSGLFMYQYDKKLKNYNFIHYNPLFDKQRGWNEKYIDTVRFQDINFDGRDEMFFTGPTGVDILTFNNNTLQWASVLDISNIPVADRHSRIVEVGPTKSLNAGYPIIFTQRDHKLHTANIEGIKAETDDDFEIDLFNKTSSNVSPKNSKIPSLIKLEIKDEDKPHVLLRDQLDWSFIFKAVDQDTGKVNFRLPLIGLPNFSKDGKINFNYNGSNKASSILGIGWSLPMGVITMDHHGSIFQEYESYFLLLEDFPQQLLFDSERSTDSVHFFKLSEQKSKTKIVYYKNEERWEIDFRGMKQIYGRRQNSNEDSISLDLSWRYWRGPGSSTSGQSEFASAWFLTEIRNGPNSSIFYSYDVINVLVPTSNKKYTREVYLRTINDSEGNKIVFKYSSKEPSEYNLPSLIDEKGNYKMMKVQTRYLTGYSVTTDEYRQDINFIYKVENGRRLLLKIVQETDPSKHPILEFSYKELLNSPELNQVILPTGASVDFDYETIRGSFDTIDRIILTCDVLKNYKINYGQDFVLISYLNKHYHVTLRMFNRDLTSEMYSSMSHTETTRFPFLGRDGVQNYEVRIAEDTLVFALNYANSIDVCLVRKEKDKWSLNAKYFRYDKDAIIQIGYDFIVALDAKKSLLEVILWDKKSKDWSKQRIHNIVNSNSTDLLLQISGKVFLIYNDYSVIVGYRNKNNEWLSKVIITLPGVISTIRRTVNRFNLESDAHNYLMNFLKSNSFQISNNFLFFNRWDIEGTKIYSEIELYSLNSKHEVVHHENHRILQDDLAQYSKEIEREVDKKKSYFTLAYEKDGDRFKIVLKDFKGAVQQEIETACKGNEDCVSQSKKDVRQQIGEAYKHFFILDMLKYLFNVQPPEALLGSTKFTFNGDSWKIETVNKKELESKWSVPMGDKFVLFKENSQSSIKLYNQGRNMQKGNLLLDLTVKHSGQILNKYPEYLVFQKENREVDIVFYDFLNRENVKNTFALSRGETLSLASDPYTLVTHAETTNDTEILTLNFRQFFGLRKSLPNAVIKRLTVNFNNGYKRITGYDYDQSSVKAAGDILFYEKSYTIPGDKRSSFGMIEELKNITGNLSTMHKIYDAGGKLIRTIQNNQIDDNKKNKTLEESDSLNSVLLDITESLEVAQFYPFDMQDEEVGYYGFENYEVNRIGGTNSTNHNRWFFNEADVVKREFSLTGENYLRLSQTFLLGKFQPHNQDQNYVASCWIRSPGNMLEVGKVAPFLKAVVYTEDNREINGYLSEVKFQYDDWYYLEVVIDFLMSQQVFSNLVSRSNLNLKANNLKTVVSVSPTLNGTLHIDHIRFSPLNSHFQATTYNFKTKEIKQIITANGLIKQYLYNNLQDRVASINENGEIKKFTTSTKASSFGRIVDLKSKIEILPQQGFYEDFNPYSFVRRWQVDNEANWKIAPTELHHRSNNHDKLKLRNMNTTFKSYGLRLYFSLQSEKSTIKFNDIVRLEQNGDKAVLVYSNKIRPAPRNGEILLIAENSRLMVWIDGGLYFDEGGLDRSLFDLEMYGQVKISDTLIFIDPSVHVSYFNDLNEEVQKINLEGENRVMITELVYDELGRQCITTKPMRLQRSLGQPVVAYYSNFVTNTNPFSANSIWKIGQMQGEFENHDPYGYYQVNYSDNPLSEKSIVGLPGKEFSVSGPFAKRFTFTTKNQFISRHYPTEQNYRHQVEHRLGGIEVITVFNNRNNTVASLVNVPGKSDLLATYEYNDDGKLIQMLSPLYHDKVGTFRKLDTRIRFFSNRNDEPNNSLYVEASYDKMGNKIAQTALDAGKVEYLYSHGDLLKYIIFYSSLNNNVIEDVLYFNYDHLGRLISTGKLISPPAKEHLLNLNLTKDNTEEYQTFYQSDFEREPTLRGRLKRTITYNDGAPFIEESLFNEDENHLSKRIIVLDGNSDSKEPLIITTNKKYRAGKLREIEYPIKVQGKPFKLTYSYDKLGRIKAIGVPEKINLFIDFAYNSNGQLEYEHHLLDRSTSAFTRKHIYNSASYLTQLEDKFLTENIYYTEGSYDNRGYGDGTISRTEFKASWHQYADGSKLGLNEKSFVSKDMSTEESELCFNKLKEAGYLNQYNRQTKPYYPSLEVEFPIVCSKGVTSRHIQNILGKQGFPSKYGHLYDYGHYQELIKAKYFVGEDIPAPLHPDSFAETIPNLTVETSRDIWRMLKNNEYISTDKNVGEDSYFRPHGKQGNSFIRSTLKEDLKNINKDYAFYRLPLEKILASYFSERKHLSLLKTKLKSAFPKWVQTTKHEPVKEVYEIANVIVETLEKRGYLQNPLDNKFKNAFVKYQSVIPEIVGVLLKHFGKQLGESEFDVEAYDIDENGNHKHFYNGFDRYELKYRNNSNQIESINFRSFASSISPSSFSVKHDSRGNVVQALHKGIKNIAYHPVSNRATNIEMVDGKKLIFYYDAQGERVLKRVLDATGAVEKEVHYVRDEFGRSLVERELTWSSSNLPPSVLVTAFIYGPRGLVGFLRRDEYYSVITDHEGSIRLIVKEGEVVAAYDYLPYGNLMRQYGVNSESHISYRYTGQEWDEEIGLYNYHARFYDPSIGRFYQHDPKMQYFSPYKYAGNSPVSMIDPNGEFAFLLFFAIVGLGLIGAYFAGAAYSGTLDITKWKGRDFKLYVSILFGFIGGALIPVMFPASVAAFSAMGLSYGASVAATTLVGLIGAYANIARSMNEWDPSKWDWSKPEIFLNAGFVGFSTFVGGPAGFHSAGKFFLDLSSVYAKGLFLVGSAASAGGLISLRLAGRKLDFSKPGVYVDIIESIIFAADIPMALNGGFKFFKSNGGNILKGIKNRRLYRESYIDIDAPFHASSSLAATNTLIAKSAAKLLGGTVITAATGLGIAFVTGEHGLDFSATSTYETIITGAMMARGLTLSAHAIYKKRVIKKNIETELEIRQLAKESVDTYSDILKDPDLREKLFKDMVYTDKMMEKLNNGEIPNSVLAVAVAKDGKVFVAFSGQGGPGFLSTYDLKNKGQASHIILTDNSYIGTERIIDPTTNVERDIPWKVALNDDLNINREIEQALENRKDVAKRENIDTFAGEQNELELYIRNNIIPAVGEDLQLYLNDNMQNILSGIESNIRDQGYVPNVDVVKEIFVSPKQSEYFSLKKADDLSKKVRKLQPTQERQRIALTNSIETLEQKFNVPVAEEATLLDRVNALIVRKNEAFDTLQNLLKVLPNREQRLLTNFWKNKLEKYFNKFTHWEPTNCAEPHVVSLTSRSTQVFPHHKGASYTLHDIEILGAYKITHNLEIPDVEPIARCANCEETTITVKKVVTDPAWENTLQRLRDEAKHIEDSTIHNYRIVNFFAPYNQTNERKKGKRGHGKGNVNFRRKREAVDNDNGVTLENYENRLIDDSVNSTKEKSTNFKNNFFGWMRSSVNHILFDSKKILPEIPSNSNVFKGIADSYSNLTAVTAVVDVNSTLLLLDTVIRKVTGQRHISVSDDNDILLESRGYSLDIGVAFEKTLEYAASKSGISMHRFNIHYIEIQEKIIDKILSGKLDEIAEILIAHAEKGCPHRETGYPGKLSPKKYKRFVDVFSKRINVELNEILQKHKNIKGI